MSSRTLAVAGALMIVLAVPAGARAAVTMTPLKPCYVTVGQGQGQQEAVAVKAIGFTPNSTVDLALDGQPVQGGTGLQVDATGAIGAQSPVSIAAPYIASGSRDFSLSVTETGNPGNTVSTIAKTSALGVGVKPKSAKPSSLVHFRGNGFTGPKNVYAHYLYKGKLKKTVKMAAPKQPCGGWKARKRQIPVANPRTGLWTVQFDQLKRFVAPPNIPSVFVRLTISVSRVIQH